MRFRGARVTGLLCGGLLSVGLLAGCGDDDPPKKSEPGAESVAVPARGSEHSPAATAGGACQLLDFFAVEQFVGVQFEVAAAAQRDATATCVLQKAGIGFPDLTLAISPTTVVAATFKTTTAPPGAADLTGVGQAAYQLVRPAPGTDPVGPGPGVEIGWLTRSNQLMVVRYRLAADRPQTEADAMLPKVADLAKFLDPT